MSLCLARPGPFLSVLSHCQDSRKPFFGIVSEVSSLSQPVSERFRSLSRPYLKGLVHHRGPGAMVWMITFMFPR